MKNAHGPVASVAAMRVWRLIATTTASGVLLIAAGSSAIAVTQNLTYDCYDNAPVNLNVSPGDVLSFSSNCGAAPGARAVNASLFTSYPASFSSWPQDFVVSPSLAQGTYAAAFEMYGASTTVYSLVFARAGGDSESASSPPDWVQSYGRFEDDACREGWHPSWAQWPKDGLGGFVCDRTLTWQGEAVSSK